MEKEWGEEGLAESKKKAGITAAMEEHWSTGAPVFLGVDGALGGCLLLEDEVKEELRDSLLALRELQAADVVLLKDSLDQLVSVVRIGKQTMRKVKQNIGMSLDFRRPDR